MKIKILLGGLVALLIAGALVWGLSGRKSGDHELADVIGGPFTMTDQNGQTVTEKSWPGKYLLVFFGYTYCPDICPTTLGELAAGLKTLGPAADAVQPLFVSVDPGRDTPDLLKAYTTAFDPRMVGLTGTAEQTAAIEKTYRVLAKKDGDGEGYLMQHSTMIYLMGPDGRLKDILAPGTPPETLAAKIKAVMVR